MSEERTKAALRRSRGQAQSLPQQTTSHLAGIVAMWNTIMSPPSDFYCRLCLGDERQGVIQHLCERHYFHRECLEVWYRFSGDYTCPICGRTVYNE
jgi:hypothetical protein